MLGQKNVAKNHIIIQQVNAFNTNRKLPENSSEIDINCPEVILTDFRNLLRGTPILGCSFHNPYTNQIETLPTNANELTARHLQILARNEDVNTTGVMDTSLYNGKLDEYQIAYLRTLVKATNVAGLVDVYKWGGYGSAVQNFQTPIKMIVVDQAGLQWQHDFRNTGGMFFYPENPERIAREYAQWQQKAFRSLYGQNRPAVPSEDNLYVEWSANGNTLKGKLDLTLVSNAFAAEFTQAWNAIVQQGHKLSDKNANINFKYLKAGLGFFAEGVVVNQRNGHGNQITLEHARLKGILQALEQIAVLDEPQRSNTIGKIKRIELPYSANSKAPKAFQDTLSTIEGAVKALGLQWGGTPNEDVFVERKGYVNASTNCADPHAMIGNEGRYQSVDAAMSTNASLDVLNVAFNQNAQYKKVPLGPVKVNRIPLSPVGVNRLSNLNNEIEDNLTDAQKKKKFLANLVIALNNPECTRADILKEFDKIKNPLGDYDYIHTSSNPTWDKTRLYFKSKANGEDNFWHTRTYQDAVKLMKNAYIAKPIDDSADPEAERKFIDYVRGNAIIHKNETSTRKSLKK